ncbi:hypothetical protein GCM10011609_22100 [Lentzea pudingi]|uniref:Uncharacterized protein n=1 Tax=Lentzea pudingi TaxID=1789439 RepID=A0ABQ2HLK0_9PSEU|nr:hypothetical protein GCM10011609_22100 [Lentzea pudingi]
MAPSPLAIHCWYRSMDGVAHSRPREAWATAVELSVNSTAHAITATRPNVDFKRIWRTVAEIGINHFPSRLTAVSAGYLDSGL